MDPHDITKVCPRCKREQSTASFGKNAGRRDGLQVVCRECQAAYREAHREHAKTYAREYYAANTEKVRADSKQYQKEHADQVREYQQQYRDKHRERLRVQSKDRSTDWHRANRERALKTSRAYVDRNRERFRLWWREKTRRRRMAMDSSPVDYAAIYHRDKGICHICLNPVPKSRLHYDHVVPLSKGGAHTEANIKVSHARCNLKKGAKI